MASAWKRWRLRRTGRSGDWRLARCLTIRTRWPGRRLWYEATTAFLFSDLRAGRPRRNISSNGGSSFLMTPGRGSTRAVTSSTWQALASSTRWWTGAGKASGLCRTDRGEALDQARRMFEEAVERDPRHAEARLRLARVKLVQRDARSAVERAHRGSARSGCGSRAAVSRLSVPGSGSGVGRR